VPQYNVAGKTGTAFIPKNGKYTDSVINTYVGFAPAKKPRFVILIKLVNPERAPLAGQTVVPAFKKLTQFLLNYYGIAPDRVAEQNI
jgi:cell division protein FtsI/penicillin-binding protein 2